MVLADEGVRRFVHRRHRFAARIRTVIGGGGCQPGGGCMVYPPTEDEYDFSELKDMIDWRDGVH